MTHLLYFLEIRGSFYLHAPGLQHFSSKVEMFLEQKEVAFLSPSKICRNLNFSAVHPEKFKFSQILLGDKNATYLCSKIISTLLKRFVKTMRKFFSNFVCFSDGPNFTKLSARLLYLAIK